MRHDGMTFTWPDVAAGQPDNVLASGQTLAMSGSGSRLGFLGTSDYYSSSGTGAIVYTDGTRQSFTLSFPNWYVTGVKPDGDVVATVPYVNVGGGRWPNRGNVYYAAVPLQASKTVRYVTLPDVSQQAVKGSPAMHIFAMTVSS